MHIEYEKPENKKKITNIGLKNLVQTQIDFFFLSVAV